jgi:serine/threonine protein phosphatase PrpC
VSDPGIAPGTRTPIETPTQAPTIGKVMGRPPGHAASAVPYRLSGWSLDSCVVGGHYLAAGSVVGPAHLAVGSPRQDAYDFALTPSGRLVVAIADGMGSRLRSQVGARLFCEGVTVTATSDADLGAADYLTAAAEYAARTAGTLHRISPDQIGFVAAVATIGDGEVEIVRVGDVSAFTLDENLQFRELFNPSDDGVNVVRDALPSVGEPVPEAAQADRDAVLVMTTDGLANDLRTSPALRDWLATCWRQPVDAPGMAEALRYRRQGSHDDRTAVVVWP